jgi:hypothetical protein
MAAVTPLWCLAVGYRRSVRAVMVSDSESSGPDEESATSQIDDLHAVGTLWLG